MGKVLVLVLSVRLLGQKVWLFDFLVKIQIFHQIFYINLLSFCLVQEFSKFHLRFPFYLIPKDTQYNNKDLNQK
jgi:hypothetical protein